MIVSGPISTIMTSGETTIGIILLVAGITFLLTGIIRPNKSGDEPESDERSKNIGDYGLSYAWLTGLFFMFGLSSLDYQNILKHFWSVYS
jgi:hypothetical protein